MSFASPDPACIRIWGEDVIHRPLAGGETTVKLVADDEALITDAQPGVFMVLFGTMVDSGFTSRPDKGDSMEMDGVAYRVYDVKADRAGGTHDTDGLWIALERAEAA